MSNLRTHLRVVGDASVPLQRRVTNLSGAVERFRAFGFTRTFALLYAATGASPGNWTSEQLELAARLIDHAHASWATYARAEQRRAREAKHRPGYKPLAAGELVYAWWDEYLSAPGNRVLWKVEDD